MEFPVTTVGPALAERLAQANEESFVGPDPSGTSLLSTFTKSDYSGWALVVGIPVSELDAPLHRSLLWMGLAAAGMLLLGVAIAAFVGGQLSRSMRRLSSAALALALGGDAPLAAFTARVSEINDLMASLQKAWAHLREQSRERKRAEGALRASEQRFRDVAEVSADSIWEMGPAFRISSFSGYFRGTIWTFENSASRAQTTLSIGRDPLVRAAG